MDPNRLKMITTRVKDAQPHLDTLKSATTKALHEAIPAKDGDRINEMFELLTFADFNAVALESENPGLRFGFAQHDARFMRSLRDQILGNGEEKKELTKAQLGTVRTIMLREPYLTQVALLYWPLPY
jgi:hypothetical protein